VWIPCLERIVCGYTVVEGKVCVDTVPREDCVWLYRCRGEGMCGYLCLEGMGVDTVRRGEGLCGYRA